MDQALSYLNPAEDRLQADVLAEAIGGIRQSQVCPFRYDNAERNYFSARMAKLADAADLKSADRKVVGVQVPLRAP